MQPLNTTAANQPMATTLQVHDPYSYENCYAGDSEPPRQREGHHHQRQQQQRRQSEMRSVHAQIDRGRRSNTQNSHGQSLSYYPPVAAATIAPTPLTSSPQTYVYPPPVHPTASFPFSGPVSFPPLQRQPAPQPQQPFLDSYPYPYPDPGLGWWSLPSQSYSNASCEPQYCSDAGQSQVQPQPQSYPYEHYVQPPPPPTVIPPPPSHPPDATLVWSYEYHYSIPQNQWGTTSVVESPMPCLFAPAGPNCDTPSATVAVPTSMPVVADPVLVEDVGSEVGTMGGVDDSTAAEGEEEQEEEHEAKDETEWTEPIHIHVRMPEPSPPPSQPTTTLPLPGTPPMKPHHPLPSLSCQSTPGPFTPSTKGLSSPRRRSSSVPPPAQQHANAVCPLLLQECRPHWDEERVPHLPLSAADDEHDVDDDDQSDENTDEEPPVDADNGGPAADADADAEAARLARALKNRLPILIAHLQSRDNHECTFSQISNPKTTKMTIFPDELDLKRGDFKRWVERSGQQAVGLGLGYGPDGKKDWRIWLRELSPCTPSHSTLPHHPHPSHHHHHRHTPHQPRSPPTHNRPRTNKSWRPMRDLRE